jgi:acetylornithine deacetylase
VELIPLLQTLVAVDSTSARPNAPVLDLLEPLMRSIGFATRRIDWVDDEGVPKGDLICRRGPDQPGGLALVGHTDCVPYDYEWKEALSGNIRDGRLYGRGSADTKGSVAAMVYAASRVRAARAPLTVLLTADEEAGCWGAKRLVEDGQVRPRWAIVGEPTCLVPVRAHKGYCAVDVEVTGSEAHSSYPDAGASAIQAAAKLLGQIEQIEKELSADADALFAPPHTTFNVGVIQGGKARNIIPGSCYFTLEWRPIPSQEPEQALRLFDAAAARLAASSNGRIQVTRTPLRLDKAAVTPADAEIVRFLEQESGNPSRSVPFGTELPELIDMGAEGCVFGPGDIKVAHRTGEFIELAELERGVGILERAIERFCGAPSA